MTVVVEDKIFTLDDWQYGQDSARGGLLAGSRWGVGDRPSPFGAASMLAFRTWQSSSLYFATTHTGFEVRNSPYASTINASDNY